MLAYTPDGFVMPHAHLVRWVEAIDVQPHPLRFIFHAGHVGSTLLSRLIGEADGVLSLREPPTLQTLALMHDALSSFESGFSHSQFETWTRTQLRLWQRGYADTRCVVVKATSDTARIGRTLMQLAPEARAILLNVPAETFIAMMLSAPSLHELRSKARERRNRLSRTLGESPPITSTGEAAAMSWLAEQLTQERLSHPWPTRTLRLDFDAFLANPSFHLGAVFHHLEIASLVGDVARHPLMQRYSKSPGIAYSVADRAERLQQSGRDNAEEIRRGLGWIDRVAQAYPPAAAALAA
ncbi:MAG: hypothetical protein HY054_15740 [Proteobacteria bacterium]|nr:hypothetical protein [Pseudomonadota bacterium]